MVVSELGRRLTHHKNKIKAIIAITHLEMSLALFLLLLSETSRDLVVVMSTTICLCNLLPASMTVMAHKKAGALVPLVKDRSATMVAKAKDRATLDSEAKVLPM